MPVVFGETDPADHMEPYCVCRHLRREHHDTTGAWEPDEAGMAPCWHGWTEKAEGCRCTEFVRAAGLGEL